jgi:hypothetical protein
MKITYIKGNVVAVEFGSNASRFVLICSAVSRLMDKVSALIMGEEVHFTQANKRLGLVLGLISMASIMGLWYVARAICLLIFM